MGSRRAIGVWACGAVVVGLAWLVLAHSSSQDRPEPVGPGGLPVMDLAARQVVDEAVAATRESDLAGLCRRSANLRMCEMTLNDLGDGSVPRAEPEVLGTRAVEPVLGNDGGSMGGRVVELCGVDGLGRAYRTEVMVIDDGSGPTAMNPVYWSGIDYLEPDETRGAQGGTTVDPRQGCPA